MGDNKYQSNGQPNNDEPVPDMQPESDGYPKNQHNYMSSKPHRPPYTVYNDEQSIMHPDSAVHMLKNIAQPDYAASNVNEQPQNSADQEMQNLLNQFSNPNMNPNMAMKPNEHPMTQDYPNPNMNEFPPFPENMGSQSMSDINGIAGFQPAPEGGQLPAPPGYKHVGYITIPAGAANLPNMVSQPNNGLPLIRPIPINSAEMGKLSKNKQDSKKGQDNKASESKPVRSFLSRLNPLNMLRRLRQRRERRQTSDVSSTDYLPLSGKYGANYGYGAMPSSYPISPYGAGYSMSGLGGMSGLGSMYTGMSNPSPVYAPNYGSYGSQMYNGYSGYPGYGYMSAASPYGGMTDVKTASSPAGSSDMSTSASGVVPQAAPSSHMPMMMPMQGMMSGMSGMSGYGGMSGMPGMSGYGGMGYPGMGSMPMSSMPMPYGYPGHSPMQSSMGSSSSSSSSSQSNDPSNALAGQTLPGGINLADLLKDEDDEPSRFRKFLGYLNPMNMFKRFRNNTSEERKRFGRYKRGIQMYLVSANKKHQTQIQKRNDETIGGKLTKDAIVNSTIDSSPNITSELVKSEGESIDEMDEILAHDTAPKAVHGRRKSFKRAKYNLMGSRNFEIIRGGTFQADDMSAPHRSSEQSQYDQTATNANGGNVLSEADEEVFDNESPEIMGFQGFNGFSSLYNSLSASSQSPKYVELSKAQSEPTAVHDQKAFQSIEHAAITSSDLKAISK